VTRSSLSRVQERDWESDKGKEKKSQRERRGEKVNSQGERREKNERERERENIAKRKRTTKSRRKKQQRQGDKDMKENEESTIILYNMYIKAPNYILSAFRNSKPFLSSSPSLLNYYLSLFSSHFAFLSPSAVALPPHSSTSRNKRINAYTHTHTWLWEKYKRERKGEKEREWERERGGGWWRKIERLTDVRRTVRRYSEETWERVRNNWTACRRQWCLLLW